MYFISMKMTEWFKLVFLAIGAFMQLYSYIAGNFEGCDFSWLNEIIFKANYSYVAIVIVVQVLQLFQHIWIFILGAHSILIWDSQLVASF